MSLYIWGNRFDFVVIVREGKIIEIWIVVKSIFEYIADFRQLALKQIEYLDLLALRSNSHPLHLFNLIHPTHANSPFLLYLTHDQQKSIRFDDF